MRIDRRTLGWVAVAVSAGYFASDVIEAVDGGFSTGQLVLTLVCEALIPFIAIGVYAAQRPEIGRLGLASALAYAAAFFVFAGSVVYALADGTPDYDALTDDLGLWMTIPGVLMILAGIGFGIAVVRAGVLPSWTGVALAIGVVLVAATQDAAEGPALVAAGVRSAAWAGMGVALLSAPPAELQPAASR